MKASNLYPLVVTDGLEPVREFYTRKLEATMVFDMPQYLQVRLGDGEKGPQISFMPKDHAFAQGRPALSGGLIFSIEVEDVDRLYSHHRERDVPVLSAPADRPWGWRSYLVQCPTGLLLDFFHVLEQASPADASS